MSVSARTKLSTVTISAADATFAARQASPINASKAVRGYLISVTSRLVVAHARARLVVDVEELVRHDRGNARDRHLDQILVEHLDPELPARRELHEVACACGHELPVGLLRFEAQ